MAKAGRREPGRRRSIFQSRARKVLAVCIGGVLLLCNEHAGAHGVQEVLQHGGLEDNNGMAASQHVHTCDASKQVSENMAKSVTLSKDTPSVTLNCTGNGNKFVPNSNDKGCAYNEGAKVKSCNDNKSIPDGQVVLTELLGAPSPVEWKTASVDAQQGEAKTLQLDESQLPLSDTTFFVGCQNGGNESKCKLDVTVQARASSVESNVAKCAYGQHSNPQPLLVELTPQNNTLTLECGKDHPIEPTNHTTYYCEDEKMKACTKTFKDILPNFVASWWSKTDETNNHVKLEIPATEFPSADQQFYIGCSPNPGESVEAKAVLAASKPEDQQSSTGSSLCKVQVTVKAASSASALRRLTVVGAATAAAALTGLLFGQH
ncbi:SAG-related sequence [Besnoitia besnoiti]|uniref:SAG-related sequence n=1 Tax=Besnoitia besnoiti TaxID=94643 RepID=A0A2A9MC13_BESBE|nr:SAG-related sequence [Besnoitia besnoiti]PFH33861.1 SAG-related sequence [Besnoitia besnoiti]